MKTFLATIAFSAVAAAALAQPAQPMPETITVSGTSRVALTPDRFSFNVGVQTSAPTVDAAVNENNERVSRVIAALKAAGAKSEEIQTAGFSIYPQQDFSQGQLPRLLGYQVNNSVTVRKKEIASASKLLQVAIGAGVNTASGLNFEVSDPTRGRAEGLKAAFDDAKAKAVLLAAAAGRTVGRATVISEGVAETPVPRPMTRGVMAAKAEAVSEVPVESGTQEVNFTVTVVFSMH